MNPKISHFSVLSLRLHARLRTLHRSSFICLLDSCCFFASRSCCLSLVGPRVSDYRRDLNDPQLWLLTKIVSDCRLLPLCVSVFQSFNGGNFINPESVFADTVSGKLQNNNIYTIAKRNVEGQDMLYQSLKLTNGIWILAELRIQPGNPNYTVGRRNLA